MSAFLLPVFVWIGLLAMILRDASKYDKAHPLSNPRNLLGYGASPWGGDRL
jgi:hypothetical protein